MNTIPNNPDCCSAREELDWLAFRYVSNELTAAEAEAFELRLADDLAAQEAVSRTVELTHAVVSVLEPEVAPVVLTRKSRRQLWWAVAATSAAVLAICVSFWIGRQSSKPDTPDNGESIAKPDQKQPAPKQNTQVPRASINEDAAAKMLTAWSNSGAELAASEPAKMVKTSRDTEIRDLETVEEGEFDWVVSALGGSDATLKSEPEK